MTDTDPTRSGGYPAADGTVADVPPVPRGPAPGAAPATDPTTAPPATPGETPRKRLADAKRHLFAHIIASAHLLDKPFTNAPDQSSWLRMKHAMEGLDAAITALDAARATDPAPGRTYELPAEPPDTVTALWDVEGMRWERQHPGIDRWVADEAAVWHSVRTFAELLARGPLSPTPPAGTGAADSSHDRDIWMTTAPIGDADAD